MMEDFKIENLSFSYPASKDKRSLDSVSLSINKGEYTVILGRSGCGKTTLLRHLKSVLAPVGKRSGEIYFCGTPLDKVSVREQASGIGYVMQNPDDQIVTDKVWHELAFGLESLGCEQRAIRSRVAEMACYFGIQDWFHRNVCELSGGQKQLLNLASVMAMQPRVLILDEPTSQLDPIAASDFLNTVRKINTELGTTVIITEHRLEDIFPYADRAVVMEEGRVIADGAPNDIGRILYDSHSPMSRAMPAPVRIFYGVGAEGKAPLTVREGRNWLSSEFAHRPETDSLPVTPFDDEVDEPALSLKEVWFRYEKNSPDILRGVSLDLPKGSLCAIVGGNGAGKSTTLKAICGVCKPYRGKIKIFGRPQNKYKRTELFSGCLAMLPQDPKSLFVKKSVREDLLEMTKDENRINQTAELCQITELTDSHPYDLSGGEVQRAALCKVLLCEPKLLLLDEPTKGMDAFFKDSFAQILKSLTEKGITILMVSHDIEFCAEHADRVSMFFDGGIVTTDTPRSFFAGNSFYTTAASRMSKHVFKNAVTATDVTDLYKQNKEGI